ncbi:hypothetical protein CEXT_661571 [Caerostris extrusa]|uniref:Secreted protein n=1 Tax=Caerostris extrusa TaxID=172846 RepID=A0AAV4PQI4_CAEEX|nr:hypothetical protein CEXT_661571 [Caerostris extrusa]
MQHQSRSKKLFSPFYWIILCQFNICPVTYYSRLPENFLAPNGHKSISFRSALQTPCAASKSPSRVIGPVGRTEIQSPVRLMDCARIFFSGSAFICWAFYSIRVSFRDRLTTRPSKTVAQLGIFR